MNAIVQLFFIVSLRLKTKKLHIYLDILIYTRIFFREQAVNPCEAIHATRVFMYRPKG